MTTSSYRFLTFINATVVENIGWKSLLQFVYSVELFLLFTKWVVTDGKLIIRTNFQFP